VKLLPIVLSLLNHGRIPIGSLGACVQSFRFNDPCLRHSSEWRLRRL
jgi:hypothetical protein